MAVTTTAEYLKPGEEDLERAVESRSGEVEADDPDDDAPADRRPLRRRRS